MNNTGKESGMHLKHRLLLGQDACPVFLGLIVQFLPLPLPCVCGSPCVFFGGGFFYVLQFLPPV